MDRLAASLLRVNSSSIGRCITLSTLVPNTSKWSLQGLQGDASRFFIKAVTIIPILKLYRCYHNSSFKTLRLHSYVFCVCICVYMCHGTHVAVKGPQLAGRSPLSPATIRVLGIELKLSDLSDNTCLDLLSTLMTQFSFFPFSSFSSPFSLFILKFHFICVGVLSECVSVYNMGAR